MFVSIIRANDNVIGKDEEGGKTYILLDKPIKTDQSALLRRRRERREEGQEVKNIVTMPRRGVFREIVVVIG
jgi:hypothetical protein